MHNTFQDKYWYGSDQLKLVLKNYWCELDCMYTLSLVDVYTFESKGASTLPAGDHYILALEDSDICIFLIDNADGIKPGVQAEIDAVKKHNITIVYDKNLFL